MCIKPTSPCELKYRLEESIKKVTSEYLNEYRFDTSNFTRKRKLTMENTINILLSMQGGSLQKELYEYGINVSASAFVQQRNKIPSNVIEDIFEEFNSNCNDAKLFKGYKVLAIDGTTINLARNPKSNSFVKNNSTPKGYNQLHVNLLYDVLNKTYQHGLIQAQPEQDEVGALALMLTWYKYKPQTLIVADRGYESYNAFAHLINTQNVDFLIRVKQGNSAMREISKLPMTELDMDVSFTITTTQTKEDKEKGHILVQTQKNQNRKYSSKTRAGWWDFPSPYLMNFRVVRILLDTGEYETLVTSLPRTITPSEIKELYHARWGIETAFRELKYSIGLVNLHTKKDEFVKQEIFAALIISNLCSRITNTILINKMKNTIHDYKINQKMAIHICRKFYRSTTMSDKTVIHDISKYVEAIRPGRCDERNIKAKSFVGFIYRVSA